MNDKSVRSSKSISMENLKRRLRELSQRRNELDSDYDHIELEEIDNEYATIEAEIDNIQYSRNDDPEIKKNRDKVAKAIKAAIENIRGLKTKKGESSVPICNFLTQHIKTASECIYNPPTINPPNWSF
jgi:chromosome segregation ATPase